MKTSHRLAFDRGFGLDDGGDKNGESDGEHADGLVHDAFHLPRRDFAIPKICHDRQKTKKILCVDCGANSNTSDVWVGGNALVVHDR